MYCKSCRYFEYNEQLEGGYGKCKKIQRMGYHFPDDEAFIWYYSIGSRHHWYSGIIVGEKFGCIHHKEEPWQPN